MNIQTIQERNSSLQTRIQEIIERLNKRFPYSAENKFVKYKRKSNTHARLLIGSNYFHLFWSDNYWVCVKKKYLTYYYYSFE